MSFSEKPRDVAAPTHSEFARYQRLFQMYDSDGSGTIEFSELREIMTNCGIFSTDAQLRQLMGEHDVDNSEKIEFNEFVQLMQHAKARMQAKIVGRHTSPRERVERALNLGLLSPTSPIRWGLDVIVTLVALYYAFVVPVETVFGSTFRLTTPWRVLEVFFSLILVIDVITRIFTVPVTASPPSTRFGMALHYIRRMFLVDLAVALPVDLFVAWLWVAPWPEAVYVPWSVLEFTLGRHGLAALSPRGVWSTFYAVYIAARWVRVLGVVKLFCGWRVYHFGWLSPVVVMAVGVVRWVRSLVTIGVVIHMAACLWAWMSVLEGAAPPLDFPSCAVEGEVGPFGRLGALAGSGHVVDFPHSANGSAPYGQLAVWVGADDQSARLLDLSSLGGGDVVVLAMGPLSSLHLRRDVIWPRDYVTSVTSVVGVVSSVGFWRDGRVCTAAQAALMSALCLLGVALHVGFVAVVLVSAMRDTPHKERQGQVEAMAGMLRAYGVPAALQSEMLSFVDHSLARAPHVHRELLSSLPAAMQDHVGMYVRLSLLSDVALFADLPDECRHALAQTLTTVVVAPDDLVVTEGEGGSAVFFLTLGAVEIVKGGSHLATLRAGSMVGELALLGGGVRTASARAVTYCELLQLSASNFRRMLQAYPKFALAVADVVEARERSNAVTPGPRSSIDSSACPTTDSDGEGGLVGASSGSRAARPVCKGATRCMRHFPDSTRASRILRRAKAAAAIAGEGSDSSSCSSDEVCGDGCTFGPDGMCEVHHLRAMESPKVAVSAPNRASDKQRDGVGDYATDTESSAGGPSELTRKASIRAAATTIRTVSRFNFKPPNRGGRMDEPDGMLFQASRDKRAGGGRLLPAQSFFDGGARSAAAAAGSAGLRGSDVALLQEVRAAVEMMTSRMSALEGSIAFVAGAVSHLQRPHGDVRMSGELGVARFSGSAETVGGKSLHPDGGTEGERRMSGGSDDSGLRLAPVDVPLQCSFDDTLDAQTQVNSNASGSATVSQGALTAATKAVVVSVSPAEKQPNSPARGPPVLGSRRSVADPSSRSPTPPHGGLFPGVVSMLSPEGGGAPRSSFITPMASKRASFCDPTGGPGGMDSMMGGWMQAAGGAARPSVVGGPDGVPLSAMRKRGSIRSSFRLIVNEAYKQKHRRDLKAPAGAPAGVPIGQPLVPPGVSFADAVAGAVVSKLTAAFTAAAAPIVQAAVHAATADVAAAAEALRQQASQMVGDASAAASSAAVTKLTSELSQLRSSMATALSGVSSRIDAIAMVGDVSALAPAACALAEAGPALEALAALAGRAVDDTDGLVPAFALGPALSAAAAQAKDSDSAAVSAAVAALAFYEEKYGDPRARAAARRVSAADAELRRRPSCESEDTESMGAEVAHRSIHAPRGRGVAALDVFEGDPSPFGASSTRRGSGRTDGGAARRRRGSVMVFGGAESVASAASPKLRDSGGRRRASSRRSSQQRPSPHSRKPLSRKGSGVGSEAAGLQVKKGDHSPLDVPPTRNITSVPSAARLPLEGDAVALQSSSGGPSRYRPSGLSSDNAPPLEGGGPDSWLATGGPPVQHL